LPEPFGPTTQVMPGSRRIDVAEAKDLKPRRVRDLRYMRPSSSRLSLTFGAGVNAVQVPTNGPPAPYRESPVYAGNDASWKFR
jgi:hypothetical protein